jgi:CRISPR-associated protein Csc1
MVMTPSEEVRMEILRCHLTLMEKTFFSSREVSNTYYTEPLIGNYALAYALGLCRSPYASENRARYAEDLAPLNAAGVYVTPATLQGDPTFHTEQFNAQPEGYWFAMGMGVLVTRPDGARMELRSGNWYVQHPGKRGKKVSPANRPQYGRIRYLAAGNEAVFYLVAAEPVTVPTYIRLGKFMSKARVVAERVPYERVTQDEAHVAMLLNPADLAPATDLRLYDLVTVPPTPLVRNAVLGGAFYRLADGVLLPAGMRFGVAVD